MSDFKRESLVPDAFYFARSIDTRTDPQNITLLPRTIKESGNTVTDLVKWGETIPNSLDTYLYGSTGNFYKRSSTRSYSLLFTAPNSHGNGEVYFPEEDYIYIAEDKVIGRYGPMSSTTPTFIADYFGSSGGVPQNTNSLQLLSASSQYAFHADAVALSITGNLTIEAQIKPTDLPAVGSTKTFVSKWNENGNLRSYRFDMAGISGYFGDGSDGSLTISSNTTQTLIDSTCTGTSGSFSLSATNVSFVAGQIIFIHQTQGSMAGTWQRNTISSYTAGTITTIDALNADYVAGAQVIVMKQYINVTVNSGVTWTVSAWDGSKGGILPFLFNGTFTSTGSTSVAAKGYRGGTGVNGTQATQGEGVTGTGSALSIANTSGGGGGFDSGEGHEGGGGGHATVGGRINQGGVGGTVSGDSTDLTTMNFGGGGGGGSYPLGSGGGNGGRSGGIIFASGTSIVVTPITGSLSANGEDGAGSEAGGFGGGGSGGSILLKAQTATLGTNLVTAAGGNSSGSVGSVGRVHLDYYTSYTGTTTPTIDATQDNTLVTNTSYQLRLSLSSNGTNSETLAQVASLTTGAWQDIAVSWEASSKTASFYLNGVLLGTRTGALGSISDNASQFFIGTYKNGAGTATAFYNGLIDEVRVFNTTRSTGDIQANLSMQINPATIGLAAYYQLNGDLLDETANSNDLTGSGGPTFSNDVPFPSPSVRLDLDQTGGGTADTYALLATLSEATVDKLTFTPTKDPQKSIEFNIDTIGTGNWTVVIHDSNNLQVATVTIANANLHTGLYEFTYNSTFSPAPNAAYHAHVYSTIADGKIKSSTHNELENSSLVAQALFNTYFQFLVNDTDYHPMARFLTGWVVGNGRYLGRYDATLYEPNLIDFGAGQRVRCLAYWREYIAVGMWRGSEITDYDQGRIYFWDGIAPTFNFYIDVPEGGINAMLGTKGKLYIYAGYQGELLEYTGGDFATKVKKMPKVANDAYMEVLPGGITMWKTLLRAGVALNSDSNEIQKGAYTWGKANEKYPDALTFDYPPSTGNYLNTVSIGWLGVSQQELLMAWQDNVSYGVDYVDAGNAPFASGTMEFILDDSNAIWHEKEAMQLAANFDPLISGQSVTLKYKLDDDTSWTSNPLANSVGDEVSRFLVINPKRYHQIEVAVDLATSVSTAPLINGIAAEIDPLTEEARVG